MKNVLLLDQKNHTSEWHTNFEMSEKDELICQVKPRYYFDEMVYFVLRNKNNSNIFENNGSKWTNKGFIKSHLQKCVRRQKKKLAVNSAMEMIKIDPSDFIRRLAIIMIEDSDIFSFLPTIIWFMVAISKKYQLTISDVEYLLGCVRSITKCSTKFDYDNIEEPNVLEPNDNIYNNCLLLRINYGGMKGDMVMLKKAVSVIDNYNIIVKKVKPLKIKQRCLRLEKALYVGMDFHVSFKILYSIQDFIKKNRNIYLDITTLKKLMWNNRSGVNFRINKKIPTYQPYMGYEKDIDIICRKYINSYFKSD